MEQQSAINLEYSPALQLIAHETQALEDRGGEKFSEGHFAGAARL